MRACPLLLPLAATRLRRRLCGRRLCLPLLRLPLPLLLFLPLAGRAQSLAEGEPRDVVRTIELPSRILGETRTLDVALPASYASAAAASRRYPVVVVLDGESLVLPAAAIARFYASIGHLPDLIVVGVRNTRRTRDLTPAARPGWRPPVPEAGGADAFGRFLAEELLPAVDRTWRTEPYRTLVGHSLGGLFALHLMASRPRTFWAYLALEPSVWWNDQYDYQQAKSSLARAEHRTTRLLLVNAPAIGVDTTSLGGSRPMVRHLATSGEDHASMPVAGMSLGLRRLFADFRPTPWRPGIQPSATLTAAESLAIRIGYPVDTPQETIERTLQLALGSRLFDDASRVVAFARRAKAEPAALTRWQRQIDSARATPIPPGFTPLEFPAQRPSARVARAHGVLGRWRLVEDSRPNLTPTELSFTADADTVVLTATSVLAGVTRTATVPLVALAEDGTIQWTEALRGIAGAFVFTARIAADGSLVAESDVRGFAPPGGSFRGDRQRYVRVATP